MDSPKIEFRLSPILHAYLEDLADIGGYGQGKHGVAKRFVENGIQAALDKNVIEKRSVKDFQDKNEDDQSS